MSSDSLAAGLSLRQMSMVKSVLELLKMEVSELISAASSAASIMPRTPAKESFIKLELDSIKPPGARVK